MTLCIAAVQCPLVPRSSEYSAFRRDHWAAGRPSLRVKFRYPRGASLVAWKRRPLYVFSAACGSTLGVFLLALVA
jgi:hypothetical protein